MVRLVHVILATYHADPENNFMYTHIIQCLCKVHVHLYTYCNALSLNIILCWMFLKLIKIWHGELMLCLWALCTMHYVYLP